MALFTAKKPANMNVTTPLAKQKTKEEPRNVFVEYDAYYNAGDMKSYDIACKIQRRRIQMLIHSYLYYDKNINLISDGVFDKWGKDLMQLQEQNPEIADKVCYAEAFKDWTGITGAFLPKDAWVIRKAEHLLSIQ